MNFWDQAFDLPHYKYGTAPNAFVRAQATPWPAGLHVLVPGDGEGRNGVWLAGQGHRVLSVDGSAVGLAKARALAQERQVLLATEQADLAHWLPEPGAFDAVVLTYVHLPSPLRTRVHRALAAALRPQGRLVLEAFTPRQLQHSSGGPRDADMLYTCAQLRTDFAGLLHEDLGWEGEVALDEGPGHQGLADVVRWVGRRLPQEAA